MRGGIAQYNALLARELAREHAVEFFSFTRQYPSLLFPGKTQLEPGADPAPVGARAMVDSIGPLSWYRTGDASRAARPTSSSSSTGCRSSPPASGPSRAGRARSAGARTILICDNLIPHEPRPFDPALTRYMMDGADAYIVQSTSVHGGPASLPSRRARASSCTIRSTPSSASRWRRPRRAGASAGTPTERVLLFFGFIRRYKGLDMLLRAMPEIHRHDRRAPGRPRRVLRGPRAVRRDRARLEARRRSSR